jgi:hypothetical protein
MTFARGIFVSVGLLGAACGPVSEPPPKIGVPNWKISAIGGSVEVRPLPRSDRVAEDFKQWMDSEADTKARLYEVVLVGATNQLDFSVDYRTGKTPTGTSFETVASFTYRSPKGDYELVWSRFGRHDASFLRLTDEPKTVWLQPNVPNVVTNHKGVPRFEIVALEGLEPVGNVIAIKGRKAQQL